MKKMLALITIVAILALSSVVMAASGIPPQDANVHVSLTVDQFAKITAPATVVLSAQGNLPTVASKDSTVTIDGNVALTVTVKSNTPDAGNPLTLTIAPASFNYTVPSSGAVAQDVTYSTSNNGNYLPGSATDYGWEVVWEAALTI